MIRGRNVLKDGRDIWYDVSKPVADLIGFEEINNWGKVSEVHRQEQKELLKILPTYDLYYDEFNEPGVTKEIKKRPRYSRKKK